MTKRTPQTQTPKLACKTCGVEKNRVTDVRTISVIQHGTRRLAIKRRRECMGCHTRFTTIETYEEDVLEQ